VVGTAPVLATSQLTATSRCHAASTHLARSRV